MAQGLKILIVDGSRFFRNIERQFLAKTPAEVLEAESGAVALTLWKEHAPELSYIAADLPDLPGVELCRQLKALAGTKQASVIMICDKDDHAQMTACQQSSCDGVLTKPIDRHKFLEIGRQFLTSIREPRRTCLFPISFKPKSAEPEKAGSRGKCLDISSGGVFIDTPELLELNSIVELEFVLPYLDHATLKCRGKVAWHNTRPNPTKPNYPIGLGIKFVDLNEATDQSIKSFIMRFQ